MPDSAQVNPDVGATPSPSLSHVAFVGWTERAGEPGNPLVGRPTRITSVDDFSQTFGMAPAAPLSLRVRQTVDARGNVTDTSVAFEKEPPALPDRLLPDSVRLFFANGGTECMIVSCGTFADPLAAGALQNGIDALNDVDVPLLFAFPDVCLLPLEQRGSVFDHALAHCAARRDRFAILDVPDALPGLADDIRHVADGFRNRITSDWVRLRHGAAYYPFLRTSLPRAVDEPHVSIVARTAPGSPRNDDGNSGDVHTSLADLADSAHDSAVYAAVVRFLSTHGLTLPPSGAVAGAFLRNDAERGVWKAPANIQLEEVVAPAIPIGDPLNDALTSDPDTGKSVNAIRALPGRGTVIWGARTLAGNDAEYRYVPVRRLLMLVELSVRHALTALAGEPNDAATWSRAQRAAEDTLLTLRDRGALAGASIEEAFFVQVGLGRTMSDDDVQQGRMVMHVGVAPLRPAEFAVLPIVTPMTASGHEHDTSRTAGTHPPPRRGGTSGSKPRGPRGGSSA